jgi:hypothetical protein
MENPHNYIKNQGQKDKKGAEIIGKHIIKGHEPQDIDYNCQVYLLNQKALERFIHII